MRCPAATICVARAAAATICVARAAARELPPVQRAPAGRPSAEPASVRAAQKVLSNAGSDLLRQLLGEVTHAAPTRLTASVDAHTTGFVVRVRLVVFALC